MKLRIRGRMYNELHSIVSNAMWLKGLPEVSLYGKVDLVVSHGVENALHACIIDSYRTRFHETAINVVTALL